MKILSSLLILIFFSFAAFAGTTDNCTVGVAGKMDDENTENFNKLSAKIDEEQIEFICQGIFNLNEEPFDENCPNMTAFEEEMLRLGGYECAAFNKDSRKRAATVSMLWKKYYSSITCPEERDSVMKYPESPLLGRAIYGTVRTFYGFMTSSYGLDLNVLDSNGKTVLDWIDAEMKKPGQPKAFVSTLKEIKQSFINYGAKYAKDL